MRKIISLSEIVESAEGAHGRWEVCATAEADYDEAKSELVTTTESFVRPATAGKPSAKGAPQDWLPHRDVVRMKVPLSEASDAAREMFRAWVYKVRQAVLTVSTFN